VSEAAALTLGAAARQGRELIGYLRMEGSGEEEKGNSASVWPLHGDKDAARTWPFLSMDVLCGFSEMIILVGIIGDRVGQFGESGEY
jgi:hypothetical protein